MLALAMARRKQRPRKSDEDTLTEEDWRIAGFLVAIVAFTDSITPEDQEIIKAVAKSGDFAGEIQKLFPDKPWQLTWSERRFRQYQKRAVDLIMLLPPSPLRDLLLRRLRPTGEGPRHVKPPKRARIRKLKPRRRRHRNR